MDNSKLNQTELSYESSAGIANVNLVTGRLLYEHFDASVGLNTKNLSVSHVYNSHFESNGSTGNNWKLDIQQYLYYNDNETDTYTYIDSIGMEHTFEHLSGSEYYDTSGMGLILSVENEETKIIDLTGNEMYFEDGKLVKIRSNEGYEKIIKYNKDLLLRNNNIISIYDSRDSGTKIDFEYDGNNLLKKINVYNVGLKYSMKYFYDNFELTHITKEVIIDEELDEDGEYKNKVEKIETMFKYTDNGLLTYAISFLDKNGFNFNYDNNNNNKRVTKVTTGIGTINEEISEEVEPLLYIGDDIYVGENNYVGETFNRTFYLLEEEMNYLSFNEISYNNNSTDVTNELGVTLTYFFDTEGSSVSVLEKDGNNYNFLTKNIGTKINLKEENKSNLCPKIINETTIYKYNKNDSIIFNDGTTNSGDPDLTKRFYIPEGEYSCSFWLYLTAPLVTNYISFSVYNIKSLVDTTTYECVKKNITINPKAVGCWQQVRTTVGITKLGIDFVSIEFPNDDNSEDVYLTDLHFYQIDNSNILLKNDIEICSINTVLVNSNITLSDFKYLTEKDMYLTCYHKSKIYLNKLIEIEGDFDIKEKENEFNNLYFPLYYNNATKAILVTTAKFKYTDDKFYVIGNDINSDFDYKIVSTFVENKTRTEKNISLLPNRASKKIYEKCFCITSTTTIEIEEDEEKKIVYDTYEYYDLLNRLILTIDRYGVHYYTKYAGNTITTTIEKNSLSIETTESFIDDTKTYKEGTKIVSEVKYDKVTGLPLSVTEYGKLKQEYFYNKYNNMLDAIKVYNVEKDEEDNIIKDNTRINRFLNSEGKVVKLTDGNHVYNYKYDELGRLINITTPIKENLDDMETEDIYLYSITENNEVDENNQLVKVYNQINNGSLDIKKYDKYGSLISQTNNGYNIEYSYTGTNFNKKIDNIVVDKNGVIVEKTIYPDINKNLFIDCENVRSCDRIYDSEPAYFLTRRKNTYDENNSVIYTIAEQQNLDFTSPYYENYDHCNYVVYDENNEDEDKKHRVKSYNCKISYNYDSYYNAGIISNYNYDDYDRVIGKSITAINNKGMETYCLEKDSAYYNEYLPLNDKYSYNNNGQSVVLRNYEYSYFNNNNLSKIIRKDLSNNSKYIQYSYDDANRITNENNTIEGKNIEYKYNDNDNLDKKIITDSNGVITTYEYVYNTMNPDLIDSYKSYVGTDDTICNYIYNNIQYDNYGKIIGYKKNNISHLLVWENEKYLKKVVTNDSEVIYKYDYLGRRISKNINNTEKREYFYNGNSLIFENIYTNKYKINLAYLYDMNEIIGFAVYKKTINNDPNLIDPYDNVPEDETYYYIKNVLGDITAITDGYEIVASYDYDAWGNHTVCGDSLIGNLNPFRYRGYYYDVETGWFWLSSRYYSPELCRWISPDCICYLNPSSINGLNLYGYCFNDPINYVDYGGHYPQRVGDWLVVNNRLKYRFDDVHNPTKEHIHVKLNKKEYSWYRQGHAKRHSNTYGLDSLTDTAEKLLKKNGVPNDYFNSISILPRGLRDYYSIYNFSMPSYNLEVFSLTSSKINFDTIPQYTNNSYLEIFGAPSLNLPNINPFPMSDQEVQVLVVVGLVIVGIAAILLAPYTGVASLVFI